MELHELLLIAVLALNCGCLIVNIVTGNLILIPINLLSLVILGTLLWITHDTN